MTGPKQMWNDTTLDKLKKDLFMNYDKYARPQEHYNVTNVKFGIAVMHLETNELKSTLTANCWLRLVNCSFLYFDKTTVLILI